MLGWYADRARPLRIRGTTDPWAVLVAEVMAQQTQIARVDEAWTRFMRLFPTARDLALAPTADVLRAWSGLGYNRRALNLQRAARIVEREHDGQVPGDVAGLEALPGVGPYTARAVAATAFGVPVAAVDTNVRRVLSRVAGSAPSPRSVQEMADDLVPHADPARWIHAFMDLGATVCRARKPSCPACPVARWCASAGIVDPAPTRGAAVPFERTTRWLRGRIVELLRATDDQAWVRLPGVIGVHESRAIERAVEGLRADGLLEQAADGSVRLPSSLT